MALKTTLKLQQLDRRSLGKPALRRLGLRFAWRARAISFSIPGMNVPGRLFADQRCGQPAQALSDPAAADHFIVVVEDGGLARGDGALGLVEGCNNLCLAGCSTRGRL